MAFGLDRLQIRHFRNLSGVEIEPSSSLNLLFGQNAQGKTSVLEAVYLLSFGRVLRGSRDLEAIQSGEVSAHVEASLVETGTKVGMELDHGKRKRALLNGLGLPRASDLIGRLPSVCFWSGDLALVTGSPADRRLFMDSELSQLYPAYLKNLSVYKRALEQRNALVKQARDRFVADEQFEVWEDQMGPAGEGLRSYRRSWVKEIAEGAARSQDRLGKGESLELSYLEKEEVPELRTALMQSRRMDIQRGSTTVGPHRDDLEISVGGKAAKQFGSQGQQRTAVISIKLAVLEAAKSTLGFPPVLLLDDIFSDLDQGRRGRLVEVAMEEAGQVFLTCTEVEQAGGELVGRSKLFRVDSGNVAAV